MSNWSMALRTCSRQWRTKQSRQYPALWRRTSITAGARQRPHFIACSPGAARHHRPDLDDVVLRKALVVRREGVVADHEHRLGHDLEVAQQAAHAVRGRQVELALRIPQDDLHAACSMQFAAYRRRSRAYFLVRVTISKTSPGLTAVRYSTSCSGIASRRRTRTPVATTATTSHGVEPVMPRRSPLDVSRRRSAASTSDPPDLEDHLTLLPAAATEPVGNTHRQDGRADGDRDRGHPGRFRPLVDAAAELLELRLDVVSGDLLRYLDRLRAHASPSRRLRRRAGLPRSLLDGIPVSRRSLTLALASSCRRCTRR